MKSVKATIGATAYKTNIQTATHQFIADEPQSVGGGDLGSTPIELLEASLASCTAITIKMYAQRKSWPLQEAVVEVRLIRNIKTQQVTFDKQIHLIGPLDAKQRERLLHIASKCPVEKILTSDIHIKSQLSSYETR